MPTHLQAIVFDNEFHAERLKHTFDDMRKFTGRQLLDYSAKHFPKCFTEVFRAQAGKTVNVGSGSQHSTRLASLQRGFGSRKGITCTIILAARDWCCTLKIGDFRPQGIG
jgi:hypothetical protein